MSSQTTSLTLRNTTQNSQKKQTKNARKNQARKRKSVEPSTPPPNNQDHPYHMEDHHQHTKKKNQTLSTPNDLSESKQKKIKTERKFELKTVAHAVLEKICAKIEQSNTPQYNPSQVTDLPKIHGSIMQKRLPDCWWASLGHKLAKKTTFFRYTLEVLSIELSDKQKINIEESSFFVSCKEYLTVLSDKTSEQTQKQQTMQDLADLLETKMKDWLENIVQRTFSPHTSQFCNDPSELAFCGPFVYPLFDFCALFDNCYRNRLKIKYYSSPNC